MVDYRGFFPKKYLAAHDLKGKDVSLTIRRCMGEDIETDKAKERRLVLYFEETYKAAQDKGGEEKRLICNITNARAIAKLHGNEVEGWTGKAISLFPTTCQAFGETTDCVRVRPEAPKPAKVKA